MKKFVLTLVVAMLLSACASPYLPRTNRGQLPGYEPQVITSMAELQGIEEAYADPLHQFTLSPTVTNFSRQFPRHHRLPNLGARQRYQVSLDQRYVLSRDDQLVTGYNWFSFFANLASKGRYDNRDQLETSPKLYRQFLTFEWEGEDYLGYTVVERYCTSDRHNTLNCDY
ncbi:hypothetical protein [Ferrimonas gelatinilytica]|uniref:Lipoprotein n=1 Tax=Ferrimonas gelatinilytica TaxID=1255257 RepID=A0ABP9RT73_9GAMM